MSTRNKIKIIGKQIARILEDLRGITSMVRGSYRKIYRRCGKPNCWCSTSTTGHPRYRITWSQDARPRTKSIPQKDIEWIKEMTGNYRKYRQLRAQLRVNTNKFKAVLDQLEEEVILKTKKKRDYL